MPKRKYTRTNSWSNTEVRILKKHYPTSRPAELKKLLPGRTPGAIRSYAVTHGFRKKYGKILIWTPDRVRKLKKLYPDNYNSDIAKALGVSSEAVDGAGFKYRLFKSKEFIRRKGIETGYKKGSVSWNKGRKMSKAIYNKVKHTMFKKGQLPATAKHKPGTVIVIPTKGKNYRWIKLTWRKKMLYHVYLFEKHHKRKVKKGHIIIFKDGNQDNLKISNLKEITRQQHAANTRNSDGWVARTLAMKPASIHGKGVVDKELYKEILKHPELIELKRQQLLLNNKINQNEQKSKRAS